MLCSPSDNSRGGGGVGGGGAAFEESLRRLSVDGRSVSGSRRGKASIVAVKV